MGTALSLQLRPEWESIKAVWRPCLDHLSEQFNFQPETAFSLTMVTQELLENAVKYAHFAASEDCVQLDIRGGTDALTIEVRTPLSEEPNALFRLDLMVQWIRGFQNPFEAYVERLKQVAALAPSESVSGLGLVRIAYEGRCLLDFYVTDQNVLAMSAVYRSVDRPGNLGERLQAATR